MKQKEKIDLLNKHRNVNPLPLDLKYLCKVAAWTLRGSVVDKAYLTDILGEVCTLLDDWNDANKKNYITFEEFVEYFSDEKTFNLRGRDVMKTSDYHFSLNLFRTCAFMLYISHEFLDSHIDLVKEIFEKEESTGGNA